jgi:hypothetical protein
MALSLHLWKKGNRRNLFPQEWSEYFLRLRNEENHEKDKDGSWLLQTANERVQVLASHEAAML